MGDMSSVGGSIWFQNPIVAHPFYMFDDLMGPQMVGSNLIRSVGMIEYHKVKMQMKPMKKSQVCSNSTAVSVP